TTADPEAPAYSLRDLAADAAALADALGGGPAHLAGVGVGGGGAQGGGREPAHPATRVRPPPAAAPPFADALGGGPAHLAGIGVGGMVAQVAALDHPGAFSALTLAGPRAVAPGRPDDDLPDHDQATMSRLFSRPMPDGADREAVAECAAAGAEILGADPVAARLIAARIWDR